MRPTPSRAALAAITTSVALGAGAGSAQAAAWSPFGALSKAKAGAELTLSDTFAIKPGGVSTSASGAVTLTNATVRVGDLSGTGVTAKATPTGVVLTGGTYVAPTSLTDNTLKATTPLTVSLSSTAVTGLSGELASTKAVATDKQLDATIGEDLVVPTDAVPAAPTSAPWGFKLNLDLWGLQVKANAGNAALDGRIYWTGAYNFGVTLSNLPFNGGLVTVAGSVGGSNIFRPQTGFALKGTLTGPAKLAPQLQLLSGSVEWGAKGFAVAGTVRLGCTTGFLDATAKGTFTDAKNFSFHADGMASDCTIGRVASFDEQTFNADVTSEAGNVKFKAGLSGARIELFSKFITPDAELSTNLQDVSATITNATTDGALRLSFKGTGVGQTRDWKRTPEAAADPAKKNVPLGQLPVTDRTSKTSFRLQGSVAGQFDLQGASVRKVSVKVSGVKFNFFNALPGLAMQHVLTDDTVRGFTA